LSEAELLKLAKIVKLNFAKKVAKRIKFFPKLKADIGNPERFYKSKIRPFNKNLSENAYRTYTRKGISNLRIIDYRFKDMDIKTSKKVR